MKPRKTFSWADRFSPAGSTDATHRPSDAGPYDDHFVSYLRDLPERAGTPVPKMFDEVFPSLRYVRVLRRDKLRQSVSDEWVERYPRGEYARER